MVSLEYHKTKTNMPITFVVKNICIGKHARVHRRQILRGAAGISVKAIPAAPCKICLFRLLCIFFSQLVFKILKVVILKMVTNMYRNLRSKCATEYP